MSSPDAIDLDHLRSWIGRTEEAEDVVTPRLVAEYEATFAPHLAPVGAGEAPLGIHWCLAPPIRPLPELGPDGHPARGGFLPPVPLPRRMWAGGRVEPLAAIRTGDAVLRRSRIGDVSLKEGRSGPLCFVAVHHEYETPRGVALRERHDIVYRAAPDVAGGSAPAADPPSAEPPSAEPGPADRDWMVDASSTFLFRYSALTFNGHRIHYDRDYATGQEGYADLVVHGPIQATLLLNLSAALAGRAPAAFDYRGLSPLVAGPPFRVAVRREPDGTLAGWTEAAWGRRAMASTGMAAL